MPVYNSEKYISEAIESILNQSLEDFEFIIIDDGSNDNTIDIIKQYLDKRIHLYQNKENIGISNSLNRGLALSGTDIIMRMDADDVSNSERINKQYTYLTSHTDCALVSSDVNILDEKGNTITCDRVNGVHLFYNLIFICPIYHSSVMFRKSAVQQIGGYTVRYAEDFELWWQLSRRHKIANIPETLLNYRISSQSLHLTTRRTEYEQAHLEQMSRNIRYYMGEQFSAPVEHLQCLRHNFAPLLAKGSVNSILTCLNTLNSITSQIIAKQEPNMHSHEVMDAALLKQRFIILFYANKLPIFKSITLLFKLKLFHIIKYKFTNTLLKLLKI